MEAKVRIGLKVVIAGGGTGGHLFPALALAEEFKARDPSIEVIFAGSERGLEAEVIPKQGYSLVVFDVEGVKRKGLAQKLRAIYKAFRATFKAIGKLREIRPGLVIGSGAYSSGPVVLAAKLLGIRTAILEQNAVPGLTNKLLGKLADRVYIAFEEAAEFFPKRRTVLLGNPLRREIAGLKETGTRKPGSKFKVLVFGGSQGATAINSAFLDAAEYLTDIWGTFNVIHQTGKEGYEMAESAYKRKDLKVEVSSFIDDMSVAYDGCDLVVCRAGATTIAEITALGLPAILVPYPFATDNHQEMNARSVEKRGAAVVIGQEDLTGSALAAVIRKLYEDKSGLDRMREASKEIGKPHATHDVADDCFDLLDYTGGEA